MYVGEHSRDKQSGRAITFFKDGDRALMGQFKDGRADGEMMCLGKIKDQVIEYKQVFQEGKEIKKDSEIIP